MLSSFSRFGMCQFCVFQFLSIFLKGHQSETLKISDCKLEWIRILQVCMFLSFFLSFFFFFVAFLETSNFCELVFNPPFCNSVYSFVGFVFFVSLAHTQWSGGLFFKPLSFVLQSSLWWVWVRVFVVFARFCFGSSQVPGSSSCKSVFVFITTSQCFPFHELLYVFQ